VEDEEDAKMEKTKGLLETNAKVEMLGVTGRRGSRNFVSREGSHFPKGFESR